MAKGTQNDPHIIHVKGSKFEPSVLGIKMSEWVRFQLKDRTVPASVEWTAGLFVSGTANPLPVTESSSPTVQAGSSTGDFCIRTSTASASLVSIGTISGTINVGTSPLPMEEDEARGGASLTARSSAMAL